MEMLRWVPAGSLLRNSIIAALLIEFPANNLLKCKLLVITIHLPLTVNKARRANFDEKRVFGGKKRRRGLLGMKCGSSRGKRRTGKHHTASLG